MSFHWSLPFLDHSSEDNRKFALIILNQPFASPLLKRIWDACEWRCCADGGANRLHDSLKAEARNKADEYDACKRYIPDLIHGDLDSLRKDVQEYYASQHVPIVQDHDQNSTDLMKCVGKLLAKERDEGTSYDLIILGGLSGRLDQTVHTLAYLYKLRKTRQRVFAVNDENVGWVLDEGEHRIEIDHSCFGPTCGLLPVGIDYSILTTTGLRWNLTETKSHFDGMVSTSNHLVPSVKIVYIKTSKPIWWTMELRESLLT